MFNVFMCQYFRHLRHQLSKILDIIKLFCNLISSYVSNKIQEGNTHFLSGKLSATLIIPIDTARKYGLDQPSNVIVEETDDGLLIKKLEV